jgi:hypothetical protein
MHGHTNVKYLFAVEERILSSVSYSEVHRNLYGSPDFVRIIICWPYFFTHMFYINRDSLFFVGKPSWLHITLFVKL